MLGDKRVAVRRMVWAGLLLLAALLGAGNFAAAQGPPTPTRAPITTENVPQLSEQMVLGRGILQEAAWSPNGETLAVSSSRGVWLYDAHALGSTEPRLLPQEGYGAVALAWSPNGRHLVVSGGEGTLWFWDVEAGEAKTTRLWEDGIEFPPRVNNVAWSPTGEAVAVGAENTVQIFDVTDDGLDLAMSRWSDGWGHVDWSPDGRHLVSRLFSEGLTVWRMAGDGRAIRLDESGLVGTGMVKWSPNGRYIVGADVSEGNALVMWDAATGQQLKQWTPYEHGATALAWSPNGRFLATAGDRELAHLWDGETFELLATFHEEAAYVFSLAWSSDGQKLVGVVGGEKVLVWEVDAAGHVTASDEAIPADTTGIGVLTDVAWSSDGTLLAGVTWAGTLGVWDATSGALQGRAGESSTRGYGYENGSEVAWSPNGALVAFTDREGRVRLYDTATGAEVAALAGHEGNVFGVAWSPNGRFLASVGEDKTVRIWEIDTLSLARVLQGHASVVYSVAWSSDGRYLASVDREGVVLVWDAHDGALAQELPQLSRSVYSVAWSPDGRTIALAADRGYSREGESTIQLWDRVTQTLSLLGQGQRTVGDVAWSPNGRLLAAAEEGGAVRLWDVARGVPLVTLTAHASSVYGVAWSSDGTRLASVSGDGTLRVWAVPAAEADGSPLRVTYEAIWQTKRPIVRLSWSPNGRYLVSVSRSNGPVFVWDVESGEQVALLQARGRPTLYALAWSPDGRWLATTNYKSYQVTIWETTHWEQVATLGGPDWEWTRGGWVKGVYRVAWSPDGAYVAFGGNSNALRVWKTGSWERVAMLRGHTEVVGAIRWLPDSRHLLSCDWAGTLRLWDAPNGALVRIVYREAEYRGWSPCFVKVMEDGQRALVQLDGLSFHMIDLESGAVLWSERWPSWQLRGVDSSPEGRLVAAGGSEGVLRIWDVESGALRALGHRPVSWIGEVVWSPSGRWIVTTDEENMKTDLALSFWDAQSGERVLSVTGHVEGVHVVAWSPDGTRLATGGRDGTIRIWGVSPP